ncbi:MAG: 16S rRNA (cytidine(1402)-2'-O)-methyltransferase [Pelagibacterales bacterium]|nr:16S rRNA (cytidine(1402)-2'-O)-methyltransferase [Pelagibacterales bacterium]
MTNNGKLFIVPTPIGNLQDITYRAIETLKSVDLVLAEDTRKTSILFKKCSITNTLKSYHINNEHKVVNQYVEDLIEGKTLALVSDAGTPSISDPGFLLIRESIKKNIEIICLPGATALIPALVMSGLPSERFVFEGFLPKKKGRASRLEELSSENRTVILYDSPLRVKKTLEDLKEVFGPERAISLSREISKIYEETFRGTISDAIIHLANKNPKGEFVICIDKVK